MAPFLIDKRHVSTFVMLFLFLALLCFVAGFFLGHQYATNKTTGSTISELLLPDAGSSVLSLAEDYAATVNEPGENVDVDTPDVKEPVIESPSKLTANSVENKIVIAKKVVSNEEVVPDPMEVDSIELDTQLSNIIDNATKENAKYSIQVGLYGIKVNAERRVQGLINQKLSGHLTSFINNKGDTLYNVRFGYFLNKTSVDEALGIYQQKHTGEGYIIGLKQ